MSQVSIAGAAGLVGGHLLRTLLSEPRVNAITAPTCRSLADTVGTYNPHDLQLTDAPVQVTDPVDIAFCCSGTTRRETGSKEAFIHADYTLVVDTAPTGRGLDAQYMLVVDSMGADANSLFSYNWVKGEMEQALVVQNWPRLMTVWSSMFLGDRDKQWTNEMFLAPLFRPLPDDWKSTEARGVARAVLAEALVPGYEGVSILTSSELCERTK